MRSILFVTVFASSGCATTYQMTLMPRDSGKLYSGTVEENASGEGRMSVSIEGKTYDGTWVQTSPDRSRGYVSGGLGWGWGRHWGLGTTFIVDNPQGTHAKALLTSTDGSGLRCDLKSGNRRGGGVCKDDRGKEYDVQLRPASKG